jgi:hypothetical protein
MFRTDGVLALAGTSASTNITIRVYIVCLEMLGNSMFLPQGRSRI